MSPTRQEPIRILKPPRFLQIHTLNPYTAVLLNRDNSGIAKRMPYGDTLRTRVSSQCLKRHWRANDDVHAIHKIDGTQSSYRSRELVTQKIIAPLRKQFDEAIVDAIEPEIQMAVYGERGTVRKSRQTLLLGEPEIRWLAQETRRIATQARDPEKAATAAKNWRKTMRDNIKVLRENTCSPGGTTAALFGRMVTSDPAANITAAIHVAHAFTVHGEETETEYFTAVDDLPTGEPGADTIQETELTSGLFYGYVVVDLPQLCENLGGDTLLAGAILHNLIYLIAEVSPGAKRGSTAPYARASLMLLEAGRRQPRSLAEAYRNPCQADAEEATRALSQHLAALDAAYETGENRRIMSVAKLDHETFADTTRGTIGELAAWVQGLTIPHPDGASR